MPRQQPVEMILLRQLASRLTVPTWMLDAEGNLLYYNDAAAPLIGTPFDDVGPFHAEEIREQFGLTDLDGNPLDDHDFPVAVTLAKHVPSHGELRYRGLNGRWRNVAVSTIPIEGQAGRFLGVLTVFWEIDV